MIHDAVVRYSSKFNVSSLEGLLVWLDSSDYSTIYLDEYNNVSKWVNKQSLTNDAIQLDPLKRPAYKSGIQNNFAGIRWDGSNDCLTISSLSLPSVISCFLVLRCSNPFFIEHSANANANDGFYWYGSNGFTSFIQRSSGGGTAYIATDSATWTGTTPAVISFKYQTDYSFEVRRNNSILNLNRVGANVQNTTVSKTLNIGSRDDGAGVVTNGDFFEFLIYNRQLSNQEMSLVNSHLISKWGIN